MFIVSSLNLPTFRLKTRFLLIFSLNLPINNIVPDTEDEEDNSLIEGPKPTEEEAEKIAEDVEQALEENFKELEKKGKTNGNKNGATNGHVNGDKNGTTNGDDTKMETDENDGAKLSCIDKNGVNGKAKSKKKFNIQPLVVLTRTLLSYTLNLLNTRNSWMALVDGFLDKKILTFILSNNVLIIFQKNPRKTVPKTKMTTKRRTRQKKRKKKAALKVRLDQAPAMKSKATRSQKITNLLDPLKLVHPLPKKLRTKTLKPKRKKKILPICNWLGKCLNWPKASSVNTPTPWKLPIPFVWNWSPSLVKLIKPWAKFPSKMKIILKPSKILRCAFVVDRICCRKIIDQWLKLTTNLEWLWDSIPNLTRL